MKRSFLVTLGGLAMTLLLATFGTGIILGMSPDWRALVTHIPNGNESLLASAVHSIKIIKYVIVFVFIPTAFLVGFLTGMLSTSKHKISSSIIASSPVWITLMFITLKAALISILIAGVAVFGAWLSKFLPRGRPSVGATVAN